MASNSTTLSDFAQRIFSYNNNNNILLAALISLLLVVLFVLLLHAYANSFFPHPHPRHRRTTVHDPPRDSASAPSKGLEPSAISAIPLFVYDSEEINCATAFECAICLSEFQEREIGRRLMKCSHGFHLECIDMWLNSHANCPVCRAPVVVDTGELNSEREIGVEERINSEIQRNEGQDGQFHSSSSSSSSSSNDPPLISLGESLKRMLSRNRLDGRIFPSSNGNELDV